MNFIINMLISAIAVVISAFLIPGIRVESFYEALIFAVALAILNRVVKPVLVILTLPITFLTLGFFYLVINVVMIYLAAWIVSPGIIVSSFLSALIFSIVLSLVNSILDSMAGK